MKTVYWSLKGRTRAGKQEGGGEVGKRRKESHTARTEAAWGSAPLPLGTYSHRSRRGALEKGAGNPKALIMECESVLRIQPVSERKRRNNYVFPDQSQKGEQTPSSWWVW